MGTGFAFLLVIILDTLADRLESTSYGHKHASAFGHATRKMPREVLRACGFLAGFSWEAGFDKGVEGVVDQVDGQYWKLAATFLLTFLTWYVVYPQWKHGVIP